MTRQNHQGTCAHCGESFAYHLIHNGFNESCYAYCAACGMTALIDTLYKDRAADGLPRHRAITEGGERFLASCSCGGSFRAGAAPRCPHCREILSANEAASWIERQLQAQAKVGTGSVTGRASTPSLLRIGLSRTHGGQLRLPVRPPNQRMKLSWRGGRLKGNGLILMAAAAPRSLCAIR